jgi:hypothetical protein
MNKVYGSFIFFFYFIKYPVVIGLPILYFYLEAPNNWFLNILWFISSLLIIKDWFFSEKN